MVPNSRRRPSIFMLGAPKCGTTALAHYLSRHPRVAVASPKEPHYFCKDLKAGGIPVFSDEEYISRFFPGLDSSHAIAAVDTSVWYLYSDVAVKEILKFEPQARFLVMVRNPVEMAYSLHSMLHFQGQEDEPDIVKAWVLQDERRAGRKIPKGLWLDRRCILYREVCSLGTQIQRLLSWVERERVHIELQDDLARDPRSVYLRVLEFMGVPDDGQVEFPRINAGRKINSRLAVRILRSRPVCMAADAMKRLLGIRSFGVGRPDLPMPMGVRRFLVEEFRDEIGLLGEILHRDLTGWTRVR